jgi:hypothetical protein
MSAAMILVMLRKITDKRTNKAVTTRQVCCRSMVSAHRAIFCRPPMFRPLRALLRATGTDWPTLGPPTPLSPDGQLSRDARLSAAAGPTFRGQPPPNLRSTLPLLSTVFQNHLQVYRTMLPEAHCDGGEGEADDPLTLLSLDLLDTCSWSWSSGLARGRNASKCAQTPQELHPLWHARGHVTACPPGSRRLGIPGFLAWDTSFVPCPTSRTPGLRPMSRSRADREPRMDIG